MAADGLPYSTFNLYSIFSIAVTEIIVNPSKVYIKNRHLLS